MPSRSVAAAAVAATPGVIRKATRSPNPLVIPAVAAEAPNVVVVAGKTAGLGALTAGALNAGGATGGRGARCMPVC